MSTWVANGLNEEVYGHLLWIGELPEIDFARLTELQQEIITAVKNGLIPETAIFYNLAKAYIVPAGDKTCLNSINLYQETHNHNGQQKSEGIKIIESEELLKARYYIPGQINFTCFLKAETIQGGIDVVSQRLEDVLIGCLLDYDVYGEHALNMDGGGAGVISRRGKRFSALQVSEPLPGIYLAESMLNINSDISGWEALPGEEEFTNIEEESFSMLDPENFKQEWGSDLAVSLGKKPQRLDLFGLGNALLKSSQNSK